MNEVMEALPILALVAFWAAVPFVLYLIIKAAVRNGVREALAERDRRRAPVGGEPFRGEG